MLITKSGSVIAPSRYHLELIKALNPIYDRAVVIVPEQYTLQAERDLMKALGVEGLFHVEVVSFKRLWHLWAKKLGLGTHEVLSDLGKKMLLRQILVRLEPQLHRYRGNHKNRGFLTELTALMDQFRQNGITAKWLLEQALQVGDGEAFALKLNELALILEAYEHRMGGPVCDEAFWVDQVIAGIQNAPVADKGLYVVEGFSSMTQQEVDFLCALHAHAQTLAIRVVDRNIDDVCLRYPKRFVQQLVKGATQQDFHVDVVYEKSEETASALSFRQSFEVDPSLDAQNKTRLTSTRVLKANNREEELEWVFYELVRLNREGVPWEAMAVLSNQLAAYEMFAHRMSVDFGVPCFIDTKRPAIGHAAIDFVMSSLRAVGSYYRTPAVLKVFKASTVLSYDLRCQLENFALEKGIQGRKWLGDWTLLGASDNLQVQKQTMMDHLERLRGDLENTPDGGGKILVLKQYLEATQLFKEVADRVQGLKDTGDYEAAEELAQVHNIIDHVLYQVYILGADQAMSLQDFIALIQLGFDSYEIAIIPPNRHYVTFGDIKRSRIQDVDYLFIVGANDGEMPTRVSLKGLLADQEVLWLMQQGVERFQSVHHQYDEEVFKTYEHLLRTTGGTAWLFPLASTDGIALKPSLWILQLEQMGIKVESAGVDMNALYNLHLKRPFLDKVLKRFATYLNDARSESFSDEEYHRLLGQIKGLCQDSKDNSYEKAIGAFVEGVTYRNATNNLSKTLIHKLYGEVLKTSVTRLESFTKCPYQHFVTYGLRPQIRENQELSGLDLGDLFHGVFEGVLNRLKDDFRLLASEAWVPHFEEVFEAICIKNPRFEYSPKNQFFKARLKNVVKRALGAAVDHMSKSLFKNQHNELRFGVGFSAQAPALTLKVPSGEQVLLEGVIDRLDFYEGQEACYVSILDYKSSLQTLKLEDVYHGLKLQLMLYLEVGVNAGQALVGRVLKPFGAFYFKVDEPTLEGDNLEALETKAFKLEGLCLDQVEIVAAMDQSLLETGESSMLKAKLNKDGGMHKGAQAIEEDALLTAMTFSTYKSTQIAEQIYDGDISIRPVKSGNSTACDYCKYKGICHFDPKKSSQNYFIPEKIDTDTVIEKMKEVMGCLGPKTKVKP